MSLEDALNRNTETMERLIVALQFKALSDTPTEYEVVEVVKEVVAEVVDDRPRRKKKEVKSEPVQEKVQAESIFDAQEEIIPTGSAPVNEGSEWYIYTMGLCARYSALTGDPAQTQAICHKHGVMDLSKSDDFKLSQIALELEPFLGIVR